MSVHEETNKTITVRPSLYTSSFHEAFHNIL